MEEPLIKAFNCADSLQQGSRFIWNLGGREGRSPALPNPHLVAQGGRRLGKSSAAPPPPPPQPLPALPQRFTQILVVLKKTTTSKSDSLKALNKSLCGSSQALEPSGPLHLAAGERITPLFRGLLKNWKLLQQVSWRKIGEWAAERKKNACASPPFHPWWAERGNTQGRLQRSLKLGAGWGWLAADEPWAVWGQFGTELELIPPGQI